MAFSGQKFIALNTEDKISMLRAAWNDAPLSANTLLETLEAKLSDARDKQDEDLSSSSSNSHSAVSNQPGQNTFSDAEAVRAWTQIITGFRVARQFLQDCALYALDAFQISHCNHFPKPLPNPVDQPVTVDPNARWARLAAFNDVDKNLIVGAAVSDEAIYCWLLDNVNLLNIQQGVTEARPDFSQAIIGRTSGVAFA